MNAQALKSIMSQEGITAGDIARALNVTEETARKKINGRAGWYPWQAGIIADLLHMTEREINIVFFPV